MKKKLPSSFICSRTSKLYNSYNALFLSISMLAAGSVAANVKDYSQYDGLTLEKEVQVIKNGVKSKLTKNELKNIEWVDPAPDFPTVEVLEVEFAAILDEMRKLAESGTDSKTEPRLDVLSAQLDQKLILLKYIQGVPPKAELEMDGQVIREEMRKLFKEGDFADPSVSVRYEALGAEYIRNTYLRQFFESPPEKIVLEKVLAELSYEEQNLMKLRDPKNQAILKVLRLEAAWKQQSLDFFYTPADLDEHKVALLLREMNAAENGNANNEFYKLVYERSAYQYYWNNELLEYIQDPVREINLKKELLSLAAELNNFSKVLDYSDPRKVAKYLMMTLHYKLKIDMLQLIRWKTGYFLKG